MTSHKRIPYLDLAAGIMTIWVLYFRALYPICEGNVLRHFPWLYFFMPWFFYKSGMLFQIKDINIEWHNGVQKLIKKFVCWSLIGYVIYIFWHLYCGNLSYRLALYSPLRSLFLSCSIPMNGAVWFLVILFLVRLIGNYLLSKIKPQWIILGTLSIAVLLRIIHIPYIPQWIIGTNWGLFFFTTAFYLKSYDAKWWIVLPCGIMYMVSLFTEIPYVYDHETDSMLCQIAWYPMSVCGCIFFNAICSALSKIANSFWHFPILSYVGENAMMFYVPHYIIFKLGFDIIAINNAYWYNHWQGLVIITLAYTILLPCISIVSKTINKH